MSYTSKLYDENGNWYLNKDYTEILKLDLMLKEANIPHTLERLMDGWQICYPNDGDQRVMDAIECYGSYGKDEDLLEIMGLLTPEEKENDSILGHLTARDVFKRIKSHWDANFGGTDNA